MKKLIHILLVIFFVFFVCSSIVYADSVDINSFNFSNEARSCKEILGPNLTAVVHAGIRAIQIIGAIAAIVKGMMVLLPAIIAKDADGLKKASKILVTMAIILVVIFLFVPLARFIGKLAGFDISCIL